VSKYFSSDASALKNNVRIEQNINALPITDNLSDSLSLEKRNLLGGSTSTRTNPDDEYIMSVLEQNDHVNSVLENYVNNTKQEIENKFKKFGPAEMFEKMNQVIYVVTQLSDRILALEKRLSEMEQIEQYKPNPQKEEIDNQSTIISPNKDFDTSKIAVIDELKIPNSKIMNNLDKNDIQTSNSMNIPPMPTADEVRSHLKSLTSGNGGTMPINEYLDKGVNLEELFPHLDDEAYQAGYSSMLQNKNNSSTLTKDLPTPGGMRGITGF